MANLPYRCQECGCPCDSCHSNNSLHLHKEIEDLKRKVHERDSHIVQMETNVMVSAEKYPNGEFAALNDEIQLWQERYDRLFESHRKLQRVNQGLEDKLLKIVDKYETEKTALNRDITNLTSKLVETRVSLAQLEEENEQNRNDCNIAIQLLHCKPSNFVAHRLETFPMDIQLKAKVHLGSRRGSDVSGTQPPHAASEGRTIRVPIPTFPPTAMVYSVSNGDPGSMSGTSSLSQQQQQSSNMSNGHQYDVVSAAIMAKVLEERAKERNITNESRCTRNGGCRYCRRPQVVEAASQTTWTIPVDSPCVCDCSGVAAAASTSTAGVHSSWRKWTRSTSSISSTETEI